MVSKVMHLKILGLGGGLVFKGIMIVCFLPDTTLIFGVIFSLFMTIFRLFISFQLSVDDCLK